MRFFLQLILTLVGAFFAEYYLLPYWGAMAVAFVAALLVGKKGGGAFFAGFFGIALLWLAYTFYLLRDGGFVLVERLAQVLTLPNSTLLFLVVFLLGGMLGGFSGWSGFLLRRLFMK